MERKQRTILVNIIVVASIVAALIWIFSLFIHPGSRAWTDNAQIRCEMVGVRARVHGYAERVLFDDYQFVHQGDTLVVIEDVSYRLQVATAEANFQNALAAKSAQGTTIKTTANNITVSDAELEEVKVQLKNAEKEYNRYKNLLRNEAVTQQQYDIVEMRYEQLQVQYDRLARQQESTRLVQREQTTRLDQHQAAIDVAEAALDQARLDLGYTVVTAPCSGFTGRKDILQGEMVHEGQELVTIVNNASYWVEANFRERQLRHLAVGNKVKVRVDAFGGKQLNGYIEAIADATGSQFARVGQDNSTGNFVKVEQLMPVKIALPSEANDTAILSQLKAGMNVECRVR